MQDPLLVPEGGAPLSDVERVVDTFIAPSKTFNDIRRSSRWWLPFVLMLVVSFAGAYSIDKKIGFDRVSEHEMAKNTKAVEQMDALPADQRAQRIHMTAKITRISTYCSPLLILIFAAIWALLLWGSFNFALGASSSYSQMFALVMYASLPRLLMGILNIIFLFMGVNTENFDIRDPVGTNIGYYMQDSANWLKTMLSFFDVFGLWTLALTVLGAAIIARVSVTKSAAVVVSWWVLGMIVLTGIAAVTS
jgi:hypothetical protein